MQNFDNAKMDIKCNWDIEDSIWLSKEIFKIIKDGSVYEAKFKARHGSLLLVITLLGVAYPIAKDLLNKITKEK